MESSVNNEREMKIKAIEQYMSDYFHTLVQEDRLDDDAVNYSDIQHISQSLMREIEQVEINFEFGE